MTGSWDGPAIGQGREATFVPFGAGGAHLSSDGLYRYLLWRQLRTQLAVDAVRELVLVYVMLNPSTADAAIDDQTIKRCRFFGEREGFTRLEVVNLYAWRSSDPSDLIGPSDPVGPDNASYVRETVRSAHLVIAAWGNNLMAPNLYPTDRGRRYARPGMPRPPDRVVELAQIVADAGAFCHGTTLTGQPRHPSRLPDNAPLEPWP